MRLGFCTHFSEDRVKFAKEAGFDCLELFTGGALDTAKTSDEEAQRVREVLDHYGVAVCTVFHFGDPNAKIEEAMKRFRRAMDFGKILGTKIITCNAWVPVGEMKEQIASYKKVFSRLAKWAEDLGMKIAIENCPHEMRNLAFSPMAWERMFEAVPSKAVGLEFDPSHLVFQGIDYLDPIYEFAERIYAFHAKDTEILQRKLKRQGNLVPGWWRFRIPGWGDVDWKKVFSALNDIGYKGDVIIEHEDPVFGGKRTDEGLRLGIRFLKQFLPPTAG
jgi:sugar phosphate isomerase/epimerase